jgi:GNAT superfamily N-acetyltransferase
MTAVRTATPEDRLAVVRLLDAANLETDLDTVDGRLAAGTVLVAGGDPPAGTLVARPTAAGAHVVAIAVRNARQDQGVGSALVEAAADRWGRLSAAFDPEVWPFYESLGFTIEERADGRLWGRR